MIYTHVPEISCFYSNTIDNAILKPTAHFEYEMILVTGGRSRAIIDHKAYTLKRGSLIFISRLERHNFLIEEMPYTRYVASMSSDIIMSNIKDAELISIFIQRPKEFIHAIDLDEAAYRLLLPHFMKLEQEYRQKPDFFTARSVTLVIAILIDLYRAHPQYFPTRGSSNISAAVLNAQRYISENFQRKLTLQEVADSNYIGRHALSLAFKDLVGITFKEYLLLFRITEAKRLLITTDLPVSEIADQVGYINVNNFVKIFRDREKITPLQYRKRFISPNL